MLLRRDYVLPLLERRLVYGVGSVWSGAHTETHVAARSTPRPMICPLRVAARVVRCKAGNAVWELVAARTRAPPPREIDATRATNNVVNGGIADIMPDVR